MVCRAYRSSWVGMSLGLFLGLLGLLAACRTPANGKLPEVQIADVEQSRFPHDRHDEIACTECHALDDVLRGRPAIPGSRDHEPCDRGQCHQAEFLAKPGAMCAMCHDEVNPTRPDGTTLAPYPPAYGRRALPAEFSHAMHLDRERIEKRVGFHVTCTDCHARDDAGRPRAAGHAVCARCHAPEAISPGTPPMDRCDQCHRPGRQPMRRERQLIVDDLRFDHGNHALDRRGQAIACVECHQQSSQTEEVGRHPPPTTQTCVGCHDNIDRTPSGSRMLVCETCHITRSRQLRLLAPRSHLPPLERPEDHTLAFRRDHAADVLADSKRCARCHTFMSGQSRDTCDECHQVMRPGDHNVTWIEFDHGPAASARADRCATCHRGSFCVACHSQPPRSHFPLTMFADSHAIPAQLRLRACLTCHNAQRFCGRCHTSGALAR